MLYCTCLLHHFAYTDNFCHSKKWMIFSVNFSKLLHFVFAPRPYARVHKFLLGFLTTAILRYTQRLSKAKKNLENTSPHPLHSPPRSWVRGSKGCTQLLLLLIFTTNYYHASLDRYSMGTSSLTVTVTVTVTDTDTVTVTVTTSLTSRMHVQCHAWICVSIDKGYQLWCNVYGSCCSFRSWWWFRVECMCLQLVTMRLIMSMRYMRSMRGGFISRSRGPLQKVCHGADTYARSSKCCMLLLNFPPNFTHHNGPILYLVHFPAFWHIVHFESQLMLFSFALCVSHSHFQIVMKLLFVVTLFVFLFAWKGSVELCSMIQHHYYCVSQIHPSSNSNLSTK